MRVAVMGVGNELLLDEGFGPACARYLAARFELPACVDVLDRAVMGMAVIPDLREHDYVLVLDTVEVPGAEPGQMFSFAPEDIAVTNFMASLHEMRFADVLSSAELLGISCQGHCLGVQAQNIAPEEFVIALTPRVAAAVPLLAAAAARWLASELGLEVRDVWASEDPYRAGGDHPQRRRFGAPSTGESCGSGASAGEHVETAEHSAAGENAATGEHAEAGTSVEIGGDMGPDGTRAEAACDEAAALFTDVLPTVAGELDRSVMAHYFASGLRAVGAADVRATEEAGRVQFALPATPQAKQVIEHFGLMLHQTEETAQATPGSICPEHLPQIGRCEQLPEEPSEAALCVTPADDASPDLLRVEAWVQEDTTDYDCDALIGCCKALLEARGEEPCHDNA